MSLRDSVSMISGLALLLLNPFGSIHAAEMDPVLRAADRKVIEQDLALILGSSGSEPLKLNLGRVSHSDTGNSATIRCGADGIQIDIQAAPVEWSSTFYLGLQKLGYRFPHPRWQVSPSSAQARAHCGKTYSWEPRLKYRGFHLHNMHPNEWMHGFLMGKPAIAEEMIRWMARNGQNVIQNIILRSVPLEELSRYHQAPFALAKGFGMLRGLSTSFEMSQQESYRLISPVSLLPKSKQLLRSIRALADAVDFDFLTCELGSTEFTPSSFENTLSWMEIASEHLRSSGKSLFTKIHVSSNQHDDQYGNFNFLPQYASPTVGVQPHTVMFYGLEDESAPVYGRTDFKDMKEFALKESRKRPTWYFPETSYWVTMDIDVPLFLTDYLLARSRDMDFLQRSGINGQIVFSTGHEIGSWLFDWTVALLTNSEHAGNPLIGLELLGENRSVWQTILEFQNRHFKQRGLLPLIAATTLTDELPKPFKHKTHERFTLKELTSRPDALADEIARLERAVAELPDTHGVKHSELRALLDITNLRVHHALAIRRGLAHGKDRSKRRMEIEIAEAHRSRALIRINNVVHAHNRYPEAQIFERHPNPSSYQFGYGWPAQSLHFWKREQEMVWRWNFNPFFMNIYEFLRIVF